MGFFYTFSVKPMTMRNQFPRKKQVQVQTPACPGQVSRENVTKPDSTENGLAIASHQEQ